MIRILVALILVAISHTALANIKSGTQVRSDGASVCTNCGVERSSTAEKIRALRTVVGGDQSALDLYNYNKSRNLEQICSRFANEKGLGTWGQSISRFMSPEEFPYLFDGTDDLHRYCPAYTSLDNDEKKIVWIGILNLMSIGESTCGLDTKARGPNGPLTGVIQLHRGKEHKYSGGCNKGDGNNPASTFRCTLHMLDDQLRRDGKLFSRKSYWDVLRPQGRYQKYRETIKVLSKLSICK